MQHFRRPQHLFSGSILLLKPPKDGEGTVFTGMSLQKEGGGVAYPGAAQSPVLGPVWEGAVGYPSPVTGPAQFLP